MTIDMKGKPCPIPVVEAKKALRELREGQELVVLVDNDVAVQNLQRMAASSGHSASFEQTGDAEYRVNIRVGRSVDDGDSGEEFVVAIGRNRMGAGSDELGEILMKSYIYSLRETQPAPAQLLLFNGGVYLACEGASTLEDLRVMQEKGVKILACGTCLNYYGLAEKLAVGSVTNMANIAAAMAEATRLVNL